MKNQIKLSWWSSLFKKNIIFAKDNKIIYITKGLFRKIEFRIAYEDLNPDYSSMFQINWLSLLAIVSLGLPGLFFLYGLLHVSAIDEKIGFGFFAIGLLGASLVLLIRFIYTTGNFWIIYTKATGQPAMMIRKSSSREQSFNELITLLKSPGDSYKFIPDDSMSGQLQKLADLYKDGLLNQSEYETAKQKILGKNPSIGFLDKDKSE